MNFKRKITFGSHSGGKSVRPIGSILCEYTIYNEKNPMKKKVDTNISEFKWVQCILNFCTRTFIKFISDNWRRYKILYQVKIRKNFTLKSSCINRISIIIFKSIPNCKIRDGTQSSNSSINICTDVKLDRVINLLSQNRTTISTWHGTTICLINSI